MHSRVVVEQNQCDDNAYVYEVNVSSCSELDVGPSGFKPQPVAKQEQVSKLHAVNRYGYIRAKLNRRSVHALLFIYFIL